MIKIICLGKIKEQYLNNLISDYSKRINKYQKLEIIELKEEKSLEKEKNSILKRLNSKEFLIILDKEGVNLSSTMLSKKINDAFINFPTITFLIGSSEGIHKEIKNKANFLLSFGKNTYPHGLFRGILLEQIYRSFKILNNETYHK